MKSIVIRTLKSAVEYATRYTGSDREMELAEKCARYLLEKGSKAEIEEHGEDEDEIDGDHYVTAQRRLMIDGEVALEWSICARGFYSTGKGNPNHSAGWNVELADEGGDYLRDAQKAITEIFGLTDEAEELPAVTEPDESREVDEEEAEYCLLIRNTYTPGMEEYEPRAFYVSRDEAEKGMEESERAFKIANSANSYGPEWAIGTRGEDGEWSPEKE